MKAILYETKLPSIVVEDRLEKEFEKLLRKGIKPPTYYYNEDEGLLLLIFDQIPEEIFKELEQTLTKLKASKKVESLLEEQVIDRESLAELLFLKRMVEVLDKNGELEYKIAIVLYSLEKGILKNINALEILQHYIELLNTTPQELLDRLIRKGYVNENFNLSTAGRNLVNSFLKKVEKYLKKIMESKNSINFNVNTILVTKKDLTEFDPIRLFTSLVRAGISIDISKRVTVALVELYSGKVVSLLELIGAVEYLLNLLDPSGFSAKQYLYYIFTPKFLGIRRENGEIIPLTYQVLRDIVWETFSKVILKASPFLVDQIVEDVYEGIRRLYVRSPGKVVLDFRELNDIVYSVLSHRIPFFKELSVIDIEHQPRILYEILHNKASLLYNTLELTGELGEEEIIEFSQLVLAMLGYASSNSLKSNFSFINSLLKSYYKSEMTKFPIEFINNLNVLSRYFLKHRTYKKLSTKILSKIRYVLEQIITMSNFNEGI